MTTEQKQCLLRYLGYDTGPIDGADGPITRRALETFCADYGCGEDGLVDAVAGTLLHQDHSSTTAGPVDPGATGTFWDDIRYFIRAEFRCPCGRCGGYPVEPQEALVRFADQLRKDLGHPVTVVPRIGDPHAGGSGVRCAAYNATLPGSVPGSYHTTGHAMDFSCDQVSDATIEQNLIRKQSEGIVRKYYRIQPGSWHVEVPK